MFFRTGVMALISLLGLCLAYGQGTGTTATRKQGRSKIEMPVMVNLLPVMRRITLREGRNVINTTRSGTRLMALVRGGSVVGYEAVSSRGDLLRTTIFPDPVAEERARAWREGMERAARNAAERRHCLELLGFMAPPPIEKGCWVVWVPEDGASGYEWNYTTCPKGI